MSFSVSLLWQSLSAVELIITTAIVSVDLCIECEVYDTWDYS